VTSQVAVKSYRKLTAPRARKLASNYLLPLCESRPTGTATLSEYESSALRIG